MRVKILVLIMIAPMIAIAQSDNLTLIEKYGKSDWISYKYFTNRVNDDLIVYGFIDSVLSVHPDKSLNLKIKYYGKIFKKSTANIKYDTTGIADFKVRGFSSAPC